MLDKEPSRRGIAVAALRHARNLCVATLASAVLGACSGQLPLLADADSGQQEQQAGKPPATAKPKRMHATTQKDILAEWGTFGLAHKPYRRSRTAGADPMAEPDYALSIQEIMDDATCRQCEQKPYHRIVEQASNRHGVPAGLIHAVIQKESGYNPAATSRKRARGLMQVTPDTGRFVGVANSRRLYDPRTNINAGTAYLKYLMLNHDTVDEVLAAYNAGPGNVRKYNGVPPFSETRRYVVDVKRLYSSTAKE